MLATNIIRRVVGNVVALREGVCRREFEVGFVFPHEGRAAVRFERIDRDGFRTGNHFTIFTEIAFTGD